MSTRIRMGMILAILVTMLGPRSFMLQTTHAAELLVQNNFEDGTAQGWGPRGSSRIYWFFA